MAEGKKINPVQIVKYVKGIDFPADRKEIVEQAKKNHAPEDVLELLQHLPEQQYQTAADVAKGTGEAR